MGWVKDIKCKCGGFLKSSNSGSQWSYTEHTIKCNECRKEASGSTINRAMHKYRTTIGYVSAFGKS